MMKQIDIRITIDGEEVRAVTQEPAARLTPQQHELAEDALKEVRLLVGEQAGLLHKPLQPVKLMKLQHILERLIQ